MVNGSEVPAEGRLPYRVFAPTEFGHLTLRALFYDRLIKFFGEHNLPFTSDGLPDLSDVLHLDDTQRSALENIAVGMKVIPMVTPQEPDQDAGEHTIDVPRYLIIE